MSVILKVQGLSKQYRLGEIGTGTISHDLNRLFAKIRGKEDPNLIIGQQNNKNPFEENFVWALRDVSFEINNGEVLGIIGKNGAGKSTLLKLLSSITSPTNGEINYNGRIASLLEVGTGFHPELTGKENIFLNGAILGMSKQDIETKINEIIEFSGCSKYIDTPVKRYSSGMKVRLGFAVAAHLEPEILIVDEVLAVGDAEFQKKCITKMQDVSKSGRTILFVSHNLSSIRNLCNRVIVLDKGSCIYDGDVENGINKYLQINSFNNNKTQKNPILINNIKNLDVQWEEIGILNKKGYYSVNFQFNEEIKLELIFKINKPSNYYYSIFRLEDSLGNVIFVSTDEDVENSKLSELEIGTYNYLFTIPKQILKPGQYYLTFSLAKKNIGAIHILEKIAKFNIEDNFSNRSLKNLYKTRAIIAPEIKWNISKI